MKLAFLAAGTLLLAFLAQASATTNYNGSASFTTTRGLNNIAAYCPDQTYCTSQLTDVQNTSYLDFTCSCKLASITINATWKDDNASSTLNGKPVAFVNVFGSNSEKLGRTGPDGTLKIKDIDYGMHEITFAGCIANASGACAQQLASSITLNVTKTSHLVNVIVSKDALQSLVASSIPQDYNGTLVLQWHNYTRQCLEDFCIGESVFILSLVVEYGSRLLTYLGESPTFQNLLNWQTLESLNGCFNENYPDSSRCLVVQMAFIAPITHVGPVGEKALAVKIGDKSLQAPIIGEGEKIGSAALKEGKAEVTTTENLGGRKVEETTTIKPNGETSVEANGIEYANKVPKSAYFDTLKWSAKAQKGYYQIAVRMDSKNSFNALEQYLKKNGGEQYATTIAESAASLIDKGTKIKGVNQLLDKTASQSKLLADAKTIDEIAGREGNLKGTLTEVEMASGSQHAANVVEVSSDIPKNQGQIDEVLSGNMAVEVKSSTPNAQDAFDQYRRYQQARNFKQVIILVKEMTDAEKTRLINGLRALDQKAVDDGVLTVERYVKVN